MQRQPTAAEATDARPVWLLAIEWFGHTFRFSTEPITVLTDDGDALSFVGQLAPPDWSESVDRLAVEGSGDQSMTAEVVFPVDVAEWRSRGRRLSSATGELSMVLVKRGTVQQTWEQRFRFLTGSVRSPQYAAFDRPDGWAAFTLEQRPWDDQARLLTQSQRVSKDTFANAPDGNDGAVYVLPLGTPGPYTDTAGTTVNGPGTTGYLVNDTGGSETVLIAGAHVIATQVTLGDSGGNSESFNVSNGTDGLGQPVATVNISAASTIVKTDETYSVSWTNGGGIRDPFRASSGTSLALGGAGAVIRWALNRSTVAVDHGAWAAVEDYLNGYTLATFINDPDVSPVDWLLDNVLPLLPLSVVRGVDGLAPVLWAPAPAANDIRQITEGPDFRFVDPLQEADIDVINVATVEYAPDGTTGRPQRRVTVGYEIDTADSDTFPSNAAVLSQMAYGQRLESSITALAVYDRATALRVAREMVARRAFRPEVTAAEAAPTFGGLVPGSQFAIDSTRLHYSGTVGVVVGRAWTGARWRLAVEIPPNVPRDGHSNG